MKVQNPKSKDFFSKKCIRLSYRHLRRTFIRWRGTHNLSQLYPRVGQPNPIDDSGWRANLRNLRRKSHLRPLNTQ